MNKGAQLLCTGRRHKDWCLGGVPFSDQLCSTLVFLPPDHFCRRVHRGRRAALAHEAFLLLRVRDGSGGAALHHEGWEALLLQLL